MLKPRLFLFVLAFQISCLNAQKHDFNWILGTSHLKGDLLSFENYSLQVFPIDKTIPFYATNSCMSSYEGDLLFSFNGLQIQNPNQLLMEGTDSLKLGNASQLWSNLGAATNQGSLALPIAGENDQYRLFYWDNFSFDLAPDTPYTSPRHLYMAVIDMSLNSGQGKVVEKNILVVSDTLANSGIDAVKHANGRDWWIIVPEMNSNRYHTILVSPFGIDTVFAQASGVWWPPFADITTQSCFSNNGSKFVRFSDEVGLQVFDFDRCTGLLLNENLVPFEFNGGYFSGISISNNSRFVYVTDLHRAWQYDLDAPDIASTKTLVAEYDGFKNPYDCDFQIAQLAPDGRIYLNSWGGCKNLHVIEYPDRQGIACGFKQHGIDLYTFTTVGLPNMPNYRLGPMDGSNCDSLGIDNTPVAAFRYDSDSTAVEFTDLSWFDPITWEWNFGDGGTSTARYPSHTYASLGEYQVCLTVSNPFGTDTYCRVVSVNTSKTEEQNVRSFALSPNPAKDEIFIKLPENWSGATKLEIINASGIHCLSSTIDPGERSFSISIESLPDGQYICSISTEHRSPLFAKFIVLK